MTQVSGYASLRLVKILEIAARLRGIGTPIGGISWDPPEPDVTAARRVLTFLEDRRVLYDPMEREHADWCVASVLDIRRFLTQVLSDQERGEMLTDHLRAMRAAGRRFLSWFGPITHDPDPMTHDPDRPFPDDPNQYATPPPWESVYDWRLN